jgi:hypothetical protein
MLSLQFIDSQQHLLHLINLGHAFGLLNIDPRISRPGCLIYPVAAATLSGRAKIMITDSEQVAESYILRVAPYSFKDGIDGILHNDITNDINVKLL